MSRDGPKGTGQPFFTNPHRGGMTTDAGWKAMARAVGDENDPVVMKVRLREFLEKYDDDADAYSKAIEYLDAPPKDGSENERLWRRKLRAYATWQEKSRAEYAARGSVHYEGAKSEPDDDEALGKPIEGDAAHALSQGVKPKTCEIKWVSKPGCETAKDNNPSIGRVRCKLYRLRAGVRQPDFDWTRWFEICADHAMQLADPDMADWEFEPQET